MPVHCPCEAALLTGMIQRGPFFDPTLPGTTPPFVSGSDRSATFMDLLHSPSTTLSDLSGPPNSRNLERGAHLTLPGIPASWAEIVDAVQKASAMAEAARMDAAVARTEAEAAHAEAEAARAEVVRAKEHVLSLEAKLDVQRESSVGPELTPKRASRTPWNAKVEVSLTLFIFDQWAHLTWHIRRAEIDPPKANQHVGADVQRQGKVYCT